MRAFVSLLIAVTLAVSFAGVAQAANTKSLSIVVSESKVLYRHDVRLSGRLASGLTGRSVSVYAERVGQVAMSKLATVLTGSNGAWALRVEPLIATRYLARAGSVVTPPLFVDVEPLIATRMLGNGQIWAHVGGGRSFAGRRLELQRRAPAGWTTVQRALLDGGSAAVFTPPPSFVGARVRVALSVNAAGLGYLGAASHPFVVRLGTQSVSLSARTARLSFGRQLELSGRISTGRPGQDVTILALRFGNSTYEPIATTTTRVRGRFTLAVAPRIQTSYYVRWGAVTSRVFLVGVSPALRVKQTGSGRIEAAVAPLGVFVGRKLELQKQVGGAWRTIVQVALAAPRGLAVFGAPAGDAGAPLRVAMSVNEAGAGFLGAASAPFASKARSVSLGESTAAVLYRHALTLSGAISTGRSGETVSILAHPYGSRGSTQAATLVTGAGGRWSFRTLPELKTSYRAWWGKHESRTVVVGVEPRVSVELLRNGRIATAVVAYRPLTGRFVQLQELSPRHSWMTIARMPLDRRSGAVFAPLALTGTLRVAMSVNQAGAGLLGASSHPFVYRSRRNV